MADDVPGITVLIATYNRAAVLSRTLEALTSVERTGIDCSIVIIDNNSTDNTTEVVKDYGEQLPLSLLKEPRQGKNCALNKALRECALKDIVVFTDVPGNRFFHDEVAKHCRIWRENRFSMAGQQTAGMGNARLDHGFRLPASSLC